MSLSSSRLRYCSVALVALALGGFAPAALAGEPGAAAVLSLDAARESFRTGLALEGAGDYPAALVKFRQVAAVRSTGAVRFHIARCLEGLGKLTEALGEYQAALGDATGSDREQILQLSEQALKSLQARLPRLVLRRPTNAAWTSVKLDGVEIGVAAEGREVTLDPGAHTLELGDGSRSRTLNLSLAEGERREVALPMSPLPRDGRTKPSDGRAKPSASQAASSRGGPWILGGAGVAALAGGVVLGLLTNAKKNELADACYSPGFCPRSQQHLHTEGERLALATNVSFALGAVALTGAGVWWWAAPSPGRAAASLPLLLGVGYRSRF